MVHSLPDYKSWIRPYVLDKGSTAFNGITRSRSFTFMKLRDAPDKLRMDNNQPKPGQDEVRVFFRGLMSHDDSLMWPHGGLMVMRDMFGDKFSDEDISSSRPLRSSKPQEAIREYIPIRPIQTMLEANRHRIPADQYHEFEALLEDLMHANTTMCPECREFQKLLRPYR